MRCGKAAFAAVDAPDGVYKNLTADGQVEIQGGKLSRSGTSAVFKMKAHV